MRTFIANNPDQTSPLQSYQIDPHLAHAGEALLHGRKSFLAIFSPRHV